MEGEGGRRGKREDAAPRLPEPAWRAFPSPGLPLGAPLASSCTCVHAASVRLPDT